MTDGLLTQYMETGFPHLQEVSGLPDGLLPDFTRVVQELNDKEMLELARHVGLTDGIENLLAQAPHAESLPAEVWKEVIANWPPVQQILPVMMTLLRATEKVNALKRKGILKVDLRLVRGLAVIAFAPFAPKGDKLLSKLANIFGKTAIEPASLLDLYITAVAAGDTSSLVFIDNCILEGPVWREWSVRLLAKGKNFPFLPRIIGISPPLNSALKQILVNMFTEVINAHNSRNNPN